MVLLDVGCIVTSYRVQVSFKACWALLNLIDCVELLVRAQTDEN